MTLLPTGDLAWMADMQERAMPGTVYIQAAGTASDGMGGYTETWANVGTVVGRIYPVRRRASSEQVGGAQMISETQWYATFPVGTTITAKQRVKYGDRTWEVVTVNNGEMYQTAVRCELTAHNEESRT
jgi:head-tail adaptor